MTNDGLLTDSGCEFGETLLDSRYVVCNMYSTYFRQKLATVRDDR